VVDDTIFHQGPTCTTSAATARCRPGRISKCHTSPNW